MVGLGLLSTVQATTPIWRTVLWGGVVGIGLGCVSWLSNARVD
jgi:hypothetical protein